MLSAALDQMHRLNTPEIAAAFWETRFQARHGRSAPAPRP